jgi:23S rRNA pseudouridine1911/1915/1917 synthase
MLKAKVNHFTNISDIIPYRAKIDDEGLTLYKLLTKKLKLSKNAIKKLRKDYRIRVNGKYLNYHSTIVQADDLIEFNFNFMEETNFLPEAIPLNIIYEDQHLLVVNKAAGMLVHPSHNENTQTLGNAVLHHLRREGNYNTFRPIHRLDRNTSGLILIAKNIYAHNYLTKQFQEQKIHREYLAFVHGIIPHDFENISAPIARINDSIIQRKVDFTHGKNATTHYQVIKRYSDRTLVRLKLATGRTHQIRVHMSYIGHPLIGDDLYGGSNSLISRQALHSYQLKFCLPFTHKEIKLKAELSDDIKLLKEIE